MENKIFLEKHRGKQSTNTSSGLNVEIKGNRKLLPFTDASDVISLMEQYTEEREHCNKIRLTCQVNTVCSNVLFNRITEIVKYEGSPDVAFVNYGIEGGRNPLSVEGQLIYKSKDMSFWSGGDMSYQSFDEDAQSAAASATIGNVKGHTKLSVNGTIVSGKKHPTNAIRDTQLSRDDVNGDHFVYHCGLDILNNHLIRSNTFKAVCKLPNGIPNHDGFNTIADVMRTESGEKVIEKLYFPVTANVDGGVKFIAAHLYLYDDILPFNDAVKQRLVDRYNGWVGFVNTSKIKSYDNFSDKADPEDLRIERPIMYVNGGDFVDMYPGRDLYSFVPKYNKYRNRMEKNWNYCITYPSSSTTVGFNDILETNDGVNALKVVYFDENTRSDSGAMQLVMYGKAKHGLAVGDRVNIYKTYTNDDGELVTVKIIDNAEVDEVVDPFIFTVFNQGVQVSSNWVVVSEEDKRSGFTASVGGTEKKFDVNNDGNRYFYDSDFNKYFVVNSKYINIDPTAQRISYKKVVSGIECDYYVRIFSRLPNFKFSSADTSSEYALYSRQNGKTPIEVYQDHKYDFESHVSRLAFARNIYSDEVGQVVFTDDIDISNIHDNLGRPLSEIFITIVKNNSGYKEWYGFDGVDVDITKDTVEFSHCFGKITCGLEMSDESINDVDARNIKTITNATGVNFGYPAGKINPGRDSSIRTEEVSFNDDVNYYGDLCCYDSYNSVETSIQFMLHRFNTAQRESIKSKQKEYFSSFVYDSISRDDYDAEAAFTIKTDSVDNCNKKPEGYYYCPHYRIPIKSFGKLNTVMPQFLKILSLVNLGEGSCRITTMGYHFLTPGDKSMIYDQSTDKYYYLTTIPGEGSSDRVFVCKVCDEEGNTSIDIDGNNISNYKLFKVDNLDVPSYAHLLKDGTCRFIWRNIVNNGSMDSDKDLEVYPFTNGAFYVNKRIDLFVRRQDPDGIYGLYSEDDIDGVVPLPETENDFISEDEIKC